MAIYEWKCDECKLFWEREYPFAKNPRRTRCPECNKLSERYFSKAPAVHFKGGGWMTKGGGELAGSSDDLNKAMQEGCNNRMEKGFRAYAKYTPKKAWMDAQHPRKLSPKETSQKIDAARKQAAHAYDKAGIDPYKQATKKPQ